MKTKKFIRLFLVLLLVLSGCTSGPAFDSETENLENRTVIDVYGRHVEIPENIETIAAIGGAARILTYAGCSDKLIGVTDMDKQNISAMPYTVVNAEHFASIASVGSGGSSDTTYIEELVTLAPDIIIGLTDEDTLKNVADKTRIPTVGIYPENMFDESFYAALELIGEIMGTQEYSAEVINNIKGWQKDLDQRTKNIADADKPSVYTGAVSFRGAHGFEGSYAEYPPFTAINARNVVDETGKSGALIIDLEQVTIWDPDIIFLNPTNINLVNEDYDKNKRFYENLTAVQNGQVYSQIAYNYNWTNMEIAIADAYYCGKIIFPEQFSDIDPIEKAEEIFNVMLGQTFYKELMADGYQFDKITIGE